MRLENIDISNMSEEDFITTISKMMYEVKNFAERGEKELGYNIAYLLFAGIQDKSNGGVYNTQLMSGESHLFEIGIFGGDDEDTALKSIANIYNEAMTRHILEEIRNDMEEDE